MKIRKVKLGWKFAKAKGYSCITYSSQRQTISCLTPTRNKGHKHIHVRKQKSIINSCRNIIHIFLRQKISYSYTQCLLFLLREANYVKQVLVSGDGQTLSPIIIFMKGETNCQMSPVGQDLWVVLTLWVVALIEKLNIAYKSPIKRK